MLVPVHVVPERADRTVSIASPSRGRMEGLTLHEAVAVTTRARMISATAGALRVFAYREAVDLRKGSDWLFGLVKQDLSRDLLRGELFLFVNERRDLVQGAPLGGHASCGVTAWWSRCRRSATSCKRSVDISSRRQAPCS